jgi:hypothetical protein
MSVTSLQNAHCAEVDGGLLATALHNLPTLLLRVAPSDNRCDPGYGW